MSLVYFLGRWHVLVLHLPIGIILAAVCMDWLMLRPRFRALRAAVPFIWSAAAVAAVLTVVLGYLHAAEGGFDATALAAHRFYGTSVAVGTILMLGLRRLAPQPTGVSLAGGLLLCGLTIVAGHHGGQLTHGASYLVEYAPAPLQRIAGFDASVVPEDVAATETVSADAALLEPLVAAGFVARQLSASDPRLVVIADRRDADGGLSSEQLAALAGAAQEIVDLNLSRSRLDDVALERLRGAERLTQLRLDNNAITDAGVAALASLPRLESLNLYGNVGITDASVEPLSKIASLERLYLFETSLSSEGLARLRASRPDLLVEAGSGIDAGR